MLWKVFKTQQHEKRVMNIQSSPGGPSLWPHSVFPESSDEEHKWPQAQIPIFLSKSLIYFNLDVLDLCLKHGFWKLIHELYGSYSSVGRVLDQERNELYHTEQSLKGLSIQIRPALNQGVCLMWMLGSQLQWFCTADVFLWFLDQLLRCTQYPALLMFASRVGSWI